MAKEFKDPIAVKKKSNGIYPWDFAAPTKDIAHDGFLSAGNDYGIGHTQPIGKETASGPESGPIPQSSKCWNPRETFKADKRG
jgi:hypothetical protein